MVQFKNVTIWGDQDSPIVENITFKINRGERVVFTGESGCGKSTTLKTIPAGIEKWSGTIVIDSQEMSSHTVRNIRQQIGYIPQEPRLSRGTVEEYLSNFVNLAGKVWDNSLEIKAISLMEKVNISTNHLTMNCDRLSGGEKQRVAIVAVLLLERPIILADEITSALDHDSKQKVAQLILDSGATVISVSHESSWVEQCDRTISITEIQERS